MMEALGIKSLREGANGMNRNAPNAANYDESKVKAFTLPDPLVCKDGTKVTTPEQWWTKRRPEIVEDFDREVYGRVPKDVPKVTWEVTEHDRGEGRRHPGHHQAARGPRRQLEVPADQGRHPAHADDAGRRQGAGAGDDGVRLRRIRPPAGRPAGERGHAEGDAQGRCRPGGFGGGGPSVAAAGPRQGLGLRHHRPQQHPGRQRRGADQGDHRPVQQGAAAQARRLGRVRAWAWGASRALDYFETDKAVDAKQVGIEGLSRYGKAALVAMAYDQRFAIGFIGSSGEGGAKLHRRNFGELVENLTGSGEYHWMAGNFLKYGGPLTPDDLPVDAHELIALCAPRPTFISYGASTGPGAEGQWVDQRGSFMAAVAAGPVFRLLGKKDLGTSEFPEVETPITDGELAFRQHKGGHTTGPNWPTFLAFADRYIKLKDAPATSGTGDQVIACGNHPLEVDLRPQTKKER